MMVKPYCLFMGVLGCFVRRLLEERSYEQKSTQEKGDNILYPVIPCLLMLIVQLAYNGFHFYLSLVKILNIVSYLFFVKNLI